MTFLFLFSVLKKTLQRTANECRNEISLVFLNLRNAGISSFEQKTQNVLGHLVIIVLLVFEGNKDTTQLLKC